MDEVYETFIISGVLSGLFHISDFWENKQKYLKHEWVATPKKWIDPAKEATANKVALQTKDIPANCSREWEGLERADR